MLLFVVTSLPVSRPKVVSQWLAILGAPFTCFLTVKEAEALLHTDDGAEIDEPAARPPLWRTVALSLITALEAVAWIGHGAARLVVSHGEEDLKTFTTWAPFIVAISWLYSTLRLILRSQCTPPYDVFSLFLLHWVGGVVSVGAILYDHAAWNLPLPGYVVTSAIILNLVAVSSLLVIVCTMPLQLPSKHVDASQIVCSWFLVNHLFIILPQGLSISPEDYTTLCGWASFSWVCPLIERVSAFVSVARKPSICPGNKHHIE